MSRNEWGRSRAGRRTGLVNAGMGALRLSLLFGSAAIALAMILTPIVAKQTERLAQSDRSFAGVDMMSTGSISPGNQRSGSTYIVRRSVLQADPNAVCVIRQNGTRSGAC